MKNRNGIESNLNVNVKNGDAFIKAAEQYKNKSKSIAAPTSETITVCNKKGQDGAEK